MTNITAMIDIVNGRACSFRKGFTTWRVGALPTSGSDHPDPSTPAVPDPRRKALLRFSQQGYMKVGALSGNLYISANMMPVVC
jgi:hypothetical protein